MRRRSLVLLLLPALFASACTTGGVRRGPVEVIRYNLGTPIAPGSFAFDRQATRGNATMASDYGMVTGAVGDELGRLGFTRVPDGAASLYLVEVSVNRSQVGTTRVGPRFGIGLGGVSGGMGGGVGGGVSTALGGSTRALIGNEVTVKIRRRTDQSVVWEGNARTSGTAPASADDAAAEAGRVASALFRDFPGQSGFTTTVP
ncbi:hypothetical protein COC42_08255 [Sphingomonas spermidinifaciens]|uniref:DUF4136 domain-containing protein n=1 Tax=Sphingomonas spermidinifaciens TaxID=1141889 RepID=A0A2A4B852_9SPHN|nr:DUF4136 domain-containing protein [Sphingomonas spermidinifaciens]PCD04267.1 hypothetical protein COC42_08255 [Sphingomonas spermidinifaciens]